MTMHPAAHLLRRTYPAKKQVDPQAGKKSRPVFDDVGDDSPGLDYAASDINLRAIAGVHQWAETDDLDEGETIADRLFALLVGVADSDQDGELDEDEQAVFIVAAEAVWDYLLSKGVVEEDCDALLNDWDPDVAERVRDLLASALPNGDEESMDDINNFVFADSDQEPTFDAVYRKKTVIRHGQKMRVNKRISGRVRLSAPQKMALRKAQRKSHSAGAQMRRLKSWKKSIRISK